MYSTRYSSHILVKLEFSRHVFEKKSSNFIIIRTLGADMFHAGGWAYGWANGHEEAGSCFSQFCESAQKYLRATLQTILTLYRCVCP